VESNEDHCNTCVYSQMKFEVLPTYDLLNILIVSEMVVNMLDKALAAANSGGVGEHFPPPKDNYVRQDTDSYMLCNFRNEDDDEPFCKWLSLHDTIEVSTKLNFIC
jgi:hypothetical protein